MQGHKTFTPKLFNNFNLLEAVPKNNFYRRLNQALDLNFLYFDTRKYYGDTGNPSIDPVVFFKLSLVGYLENITSDRELIGFCSMRLDVLLFLGYDIDEKLPWHSTISRTRQLYPESVFEKFFNQVFKMCVDAGMVKGEVQASDSAHVKANASLESLEPKHPIEPPDEHARKVKALNTDKTKKSKTGRGPAIEKKLPPAKEELPKLQEPEMQAADQADTQAAAIPQQTSQDFEKESVDHPDPTNEPKPKDKPTSDTQGEGNKKPSNKTHTSKTDPDSRMATKPGKACKLNYLASMSVDTTNHVITHIQADYADKRDSQCYQDLVMRTKDRLAANELEMKVSLADTNYSNGENYQFLDQQQLEGYIPVHGKYQKDREGFIYDKENDRWICTQGKYLSFYKQYDKSETEKQRWYRAELSDCKDCPLKKQCFGGKNARKLLVINAYKDQYDKMIDRMESTMGKAMVRKRHSTVEPVFGSLINYTGMGKINVIGIKGANKVMLMAGTAYNLKKWMKFTSQKAQTGTMTAIRGADNLKNELLRTVLDLFNRFLISAPILPRTYPSA